MRTNIISYVLDSENRKRIVITLLEYPKRQWACSSLEELTKIPHATVFRTLKGLVYFGMLKSIKINKKDIIYEVVKSPITKELKRAININKITSKKIAKYFTNKIKYKEVYSVILYGSSVKGDMTPKSDIDILIILKKPNKILENKIFDIASRVSSKLNKTISPNIMNIKELNKEKNTLFIKSIKNNSEVVYGKKPF